MSVLAYLIYILLYVQGRRKPSESGAAQSNQKPAGPGQGPGVGSAKALSILHLILS